MPKLPFAGISPTVPNSCWIAPDAWVIGDATLGEKCSVFFTAVVRGDVMPICVGKGTNIQDGAILHTSTNHLPCIVGDDVTVGHRAIVHGCTVESRCIIGMGSTILDGAVIGEGSIVGANSLITKNFKVPAGSLVLGSPARVVRPLTKDEHQEILESAKRYRETAANYKIV